MTGFAMGPALLFCPADRPERYEKAAARADAVILDLEDAVSADAKPAARLDLADVTLDPARTIVRLNPAGTDDLGEDLRALAATPYRTVMLAKTAAASDVLAAGPLRRDRPGRDGGRRRQRRGDRRQAERRRPDVGCRGPGRVAGRHVEPAGRRARTGTSPCTRARPSLLAAGAFGKAAIDAVHLDIGDLDGLAAEAADAAASGFAATACIHPSQVPVVRAAYRPSDAEVRWAHGGARGRRGAARRVPVGREAGRRPDPQARGARAAARGILRSTSRSDPHGAGQCSALITK